MNSERRKEFWDRIEDVRTGMFEVGAHFIPMSHSTEPEDGNLWFITSRGSAVAQLAEGGGNARYIVCNDDKSIYTEIHGRAEISHNRAKLDDVWNAVASTWFDHGKDDPEVILVKYRPGTAEVWLGPESGISFLFKMAAATVTGDRPDLGEQFNIIF